MPNVENILESNLLPIWARAERLIRRGIHKLMPAPEFKAASQEVELREEHDLSWHHIPVTVRGFLRLRRDIPACEAVIEFPNDELKAAKLRWRSDLPYGSSETVLIHGKDRKLPIVLRQDNSDRAILTDEKFLKRRENISGTMNDWANMDYDFTMIPEGKYEFVIKLISGSLSWTSPKYVLSVPAAGHSNSHFSIRM